MLIAVLVPGKLDMGSAGFAYALEQAHLPGLIIAGVLLVLSVVSWSVMFSKLAMVSSAAQKNYRFIYGFRKANSFMAPHEANFTVPGSPLFALYRAASRELAIHLLGPDKEENASTRDAPVQTITPNHMDAIHASMDRAIGETVLKLESKMTFLATAVSGAPFLGLLGTVWGVMEAFSGVAASSSSASIQSLAPGVSAALVTTVIALLVAIPAMFGYNFIVNRIRTLVLEMHNFSSELSALIEREYVDYYPSTVFPATAYAEFESPLPPLPEGPDAFRPSKPGTATHRIRIEGPPINPIAEQAAAARRRAREDARRQPSAIEPPPNQPPSHRGRAS